MELNVDTTINPDSVVMLSVMLLIVAALIILMVKIAQ